MNEDVSPMEKWWFSIAMLVYQRVLNIYTTMPCEDRCLQGSDLDTTFVKGSKVTPPKPKE